MKLFCFVFAVLCYLAGREVIIIPPFMYKSIHFPKVSQHTFKTKGLISIEGTFWGESLYIERSVAYIRHSFSVDQYDLIISRSFTGIYVDAERRTSQLLKCIS